MSALPVSITRHAADRMRQRGIRESNLNIILELAEEIRPDVYFLSDKAAHQEIQRLKQRIRKIEKMKGVVVVISNGRIVTTYKSIKGGKHRRRK